MGQEGEGPGAMMQRKRRHRRAPGRTRRKGMPQRRDQHRPTPSGHRATCRGATPQTHAAEPRIGRRTDHTGSGPPATGIHTGEGGHTQTGRRGYTHRGSRREHRRAAHHHALTARRRPRPQQGPPHRQQKRRGARPQHPGLEARTPRGHGTKTQAPREGNPADTGLTHQHGPSELPHTGPHPPATSQPHSDSHSAPRHGPD